MDWIRRNWPDLLIGIALIAVIAGIVATLLTGGSFLPLGGQSDRPAAAGQPVSSSNPSPSDPERTAVDPNISGTVTINVPGGEDEEEEGTSTGVQVTALPLPGSESGGETAAEESADTSPVQSTTPAEQPTAAAGTDDAPAAPASTGAQVADPDGEFRVSVGAFSSNENAERQAATFRSAGFPVFIGTQGNLFIVLVGPYDNLNEAEQAAATINAGDYDIEPVIYRFQPDDETAQASSSSGASGSSTTASTQTDTSSGQGSSTASTPDRARPAAQVLSEASGSFLQVGAYATFESAEPFIDDLQAMGFNVVPITESSLIKLLVGPYSGDDLSEARARLREEGIENFPR